MNGENAITSSSLATTWEESIRLFCLQSELEVVDTTTGGPTVELDSVMLRTLEPLTEPRVSELFLDPQLIAEYANLLTRPSRRRPAEVLTIADRIYAYPDSAGAKLDQLRRVAAALRGNPTTRRAIIQLWHPGLDLGGGLSGTPSGHCFIQFAIRANALNAIVCSRSVDAWTGALPNMLTFVGLQEKLAHQLGLPVGTYTHFIVSYHIHLRDLPSAMEAFGY